MKTIAIIQSNYIPWKGYFNIIKCVDEFVLLDDVQYTRRDWRNRNLIKTENGLKWLTIPVKVKDHHNVQIKDVEAAGTKWREDHWHQVSNAYRKARFFSSFAPLIEDLYLNDDETNLSRINFSFIALVNKILKIQTPIRWSMEFNAPKGKSERLVHICRSLGAKQYVSGEAAKGYLDETLFQANEIKVVWADYSNFPKYRQLHQPFEHRVSIIDLLFNEGPEAFLWLKDKIWD